MLGLLKKGKYGITTIIDEAEVIIVNTCGFIESAKQESIDEVLKAALFKDKNCKKLIVTGCLAERYKADILSEIPEVDAVIGTGRVEDIVNIIDSYDDNRNDALVEKSVEEKTFIGQLENVSYLNNERILSTNSGYAYLKIAEGCNNCCTYCIIPKLRGKYISRKIEDVEKEAISLSEKGIKEIILVAQDVTSFGIDIYKEKKLVDLIKILSKIEGIEWIRLLYCYPEEMDDDLINEMATNKKVLKYLDLPIQHASDKILKMMGRRGSKSEIKDLINKLREKIPNIVLRTSLIVGFPGEDEDDIKTLCEFVEEIKFDRLGVFTYSKEDGTKAAKLKPHVSKKEKEKRQERIMKIQNEISIISNKKRLDNIYRVMLDGVADDGIFYKGRSYAETPEIDGMIYFTSEEPLEIGSFVNVRILDTEDYDLIGVTQNESSE
jgi:ribosomal protein S12 methylthiotransferase